MKLLSCFGKEFTVATTWNELTGEQLVKVIKLFMRPKLTDLVAKVELFKILTGNGSLKTWYNGSFELEELLYLTDFMFGDNTLTQNSIPEYKGRYGPKDDFDNIVMSEFFFADSFYMMYKTDNKNLKALNHLVAILYRPCKSDYDMKKNPDGDVREAFNSNLVDFYTEQVSDWPVEVKLAILQWWEGCKLHLTKSYPEVFSGRSSEPAVHGLWSVMRGVADKGIHGDMNAVERMLIKIFMLESTEIVLEARKLEQQTKK